jgi:hypothetical protein
MPREREREKETNEFLSTEPNSFLSARHKINFGKTLTLPNWAKGDQLSGPTFQLARFQRKKIKVS